MPISKNAKAAASKNPDSIPMSTTVKGEERFVSTEKSIKLIKPAYSKRKNAKAGKGGK